MNKKEKFVTKYAEYYKQLFNDTAKSIEFLANIQRDCPKEYNAIKEFPTNPNAIQELIANDLKPDKQATLLRLLLNAGNLAKRMSDLLYLTEKEKRSLARDLKKTARGI